MVGVGVGGEGSMGRGGIITLTFVGFFSPVFFIFILPSLFFFFFLSLPKIPPLYVVHAGKMPLHRA